AYHYLCMFLIELKNVARIRGDLDILRIFPEYITNSAYLIAIWEIECHMAKCHLLAHLFSHSGWSTPQVLAFGVVAKTFETAFISCLHQAISHALGGPSLLIPNILFLAFGQLDEL
ncbi:hypothetical protein ACJX0J_020160, partial [Zea mays]